jgi:DNA-binding transcriptional ArsR family regulator
MPGMDKFSDVSPAEIAAIASVLSDPARAAILISLLDGRARTAGELAFVAGISAPTASSHLTKLVDSGLITVIPQGRHRYHRLVRPEAAQALEALTVLVASPSRRPRTPGPRDKALREGRTCYDHFAGHLGVALADTLLARGCVAEDGPNFRVTEEGEHRLARMDVDVSALRIERRPLCRRCIDWSERRPHLAGSVGAKLTASCLSAGWVERIGDTRGIRVTDVGRHAFLDILGLDLRLPVAA